MQAAIKTTDGEFWVGAGLKPEDWLNKSIFSLKQDTRMLGEYIVKMGGQFLKEIIT